MPRKESTGVVSTISASKKSSLDPSKHSALTTSVLAFPIVITRDNQQQGPSCSTNVQPNLQTHGGNVMVVPNPANKTVIHISLSTSSDTILATFVYANPTRHFQQDLWHHLVDLSYSINSPWVVLGDFNATLSLVDRQGCSSNLPECSFQDMVTDCGLHALDYSEPNFSWSHGNYSVCLDRFFGNAYWFEKFPNSLLHHLLRMKSGHRPILLSSDD
ncbi:hypothetical protein V6N13_130582 [Hibiscus sabdariffa]